MANARLSLGEWIRDSSIILLGFPRFFKTATRESRCDVWPDCGWVILTGCQVNHGEPKPYFPYTFSNSVQLLGEPKILKEYPKLNRACCKEFLFFGYDKQYIFSLTCLGALSACYHLIWQLPVLWLRQFFCLPYAMLIRFNLPTQK